MMMMMIWYLLTMLKTKPIVFEKALLGSNHETVEQLKELTSKRKAIEESINERSNTAEAISASGISITSHSQQDIERLEHYLALLENLVHHLNTKAKNRRMLSCISDLKIRWSSVLTSSSSSIFHLRGPKFHQVNDINFELAMTLFLYAATLRDRASQLASSDLVQSAALFRKAAGVYTHLSQEVAIYLVPDQDMIPEATPHISSVMSLVCLAEAQAVTARKAEESGKSRGLIAKLHYGVTEFLVEASEMLRSTTNGCKDISSRLPDYMLSCKSLHELKCYRYMAEGLEEDGKIGVAIAVLDGAISNAKKSMPREESWRMVVKEAVDELALLLRKYERHNEFVWYNKVPCNNQLPLPKSQKIVSLIPYQPLKLETKLVFKM